MTTWRDGAGIRPLTARHHLPATMRRLLPVASLATVLLSGCGPTPPLEIAFRDYPSDVAYGAPTTPAPAAPVATPQPAPPPVAVPPPPVVVPQGGSTPPPSAVATAVPVPTAAPTLAPPPPAACPTAPGTAAADLPADPQSTVPPVAASYRWRNSGSYAADTASGAPRTLLPDAATHTVRNVSTPDPNTGTYTFDELDTGGGPTGTDQVVSSYQVVPEPPTGGSQAGVSTSQAAGIYLTAVSTADAGTTTVARYAPPLIVIQFPTTDLPSWTTASTDTLTRRVTNLAGAVTGHHVLDACGVLIDTWEVHATGTVTGPDISLTVDETYDVATQYGGLIVRRAGTETGSRAAGGPQTELKYDDHTAELPHSNLQRSARIGERTG